MRPATPSEERPEQKGTLERSLAQKAVAGAMWTMATSVGARAVGLAGTLLLTRFLDPDEYGEVSLASVVILTASTVSSCGLSQYIVSKPRAGRAAAFHATFYFTILGVAALGVALLFGKPIGELVSAPNLDRFLPGLAFAALLERAATIQDRILVRDMRFRAVGLLRSLGEVIYSGLSVALAAHGAGRWWGGGNAVVIASIARSAARLLALSWTTPRREWLEPCRITWERTRELFTFALPMSVATIAGFGSRRWDNLVFSHHFGQAEAGIYNLAYNLADIPATQIAETAGDVLVPSFASMDDRARRRRALMLSLRQMTLLISPLAFGLGAVAPALSSTFFDSRWSGLGLELCLLSVLSAVRPIAWIGSSYLQVLDRPRTIMILEIVKTSAVVVTMHLVASFVPSLVGPGHGVWSRGEPWACISVGVVFTLNALAYLWTFKKVDDIPVAAQLAELLPPLLACVPMVAAVLGVERLLTASTQPGTRLVIEVATGALVFVPSAFVIARTASRELCALVATALSLRRATTAAM